MNQSIDLQCQSFSPLVGFNMLQISTERYFRKNYRTMFYNNITSETESFDLKLLHGPLLLEVSLLHYINYRVFNKSSLIKTLSLNMRKLWEVSLSFPLIRGVS